MDERFSEQLKQCKTTEECLKLLQTRLEVPGPLPKAARLWGGADVVVRFHPAAAAKNGERGLFGFYPPPRRVVSQYARELSWLFEALRDAFYLESLIDGCSKIEFFGRLANAANWKIAENPAADAKEQCDAVFREAVLMYSEIRKHEFRYLLVASGGEIADDRTVRRGETALD